jgi:hypothetical protein
MVPVESHDRFWVCFSFAPDREILTTRATSMPNDQHALTEPSKPEPNVLQAAPKEAPAKQPAAKKSPPKKVVARIRAAKKPVPKPVQAKHAKMKPAPKKRAKKKPATKRRAAKKAAPKQGAVKKSVAKKPAAKKAGPKKRKRKRQPPSTKAQAIRDEAKKIGRKVRGRDIIAAPAAKGIGVTPAQVSNTLKAAGFRRVRRRKTTKVEASMRATPGNSRDSTFAISGLVQTKKLADQLGGTARLKEVLAALERLI